MEQQKMLWEHESKLACFPSAITVGTSAYTRTRGRAEQLEVRHGRRAEAQAGGRKSRSDARASERME